MRVLRWFALWLPGVADGGLVSPQGIIARAALSPPLVATVLALFVGLIPAIQNLFFGEGAIFGLTITAALDDFGQCAIPSTLLVLGAQVR